VLSGAVALFTGASCFKVGNPTMKKGSIK